MVLPKDGVEYILRKNCENSRKKPFHFLFFCNFEKTKMAFCSGNFLYNCLIFKAPPSQSRFPLYEILFQTLRKKFVENFGV